jgi:hypothetical protein
MAHLNCLPDVIVLPKQSAPGVRGAVGLDGRLHEEQLCDHALVQLPLERHAAGALHPLRHCSRSEVRAYSGQYWCQTAETSAIRAS